MKNQTYKISEKEFMEQIIELGHSYNWRIAHFRPAMKKDGTWVTPVSADGKGFPDLVLVKPKHKVIFLELKSEKAKLSIEQENWWRLLRQAKGIYVNMFRPSDWDYIVKLLTE